MSRYSLCGFCVSTMPVAFGLAPRRPAEIRRCPRRRSDARVRSPANCGRTPCATRPSSRRSSGGVRVATRVLLEGTVNALLEEIRTVVSAGKHERGHSQHDRQPCPSPPAHSRCTGAARRERYILFSRHQQHHVQHARRPQARTRAAGAASIAPPAQAARTETLRIAMRIAWVRLCLNTTGYRTLSTKSSLRGITPV